MATEVYLRRKMGALYPVSRGDEEALMALPEGVTVKASITQPRNVQHHRKFMALLNVVFPHQETYATFDSFHAAIKVALGYGDTVVLPDERVIIVPKSISFAKMDQKAFEQFYQRAVDLICNKVIPGLGKPELQQQVNEILEGRSAA